jgi:hypothetical protein
LRLGEQGKYGYCIGNWYEDGSCDLHLWPIETANSVDILLGDFQLSELKRQHRPESM